MFAVDVRRDPRGLVFVLRGELDFHSVVQLYEAGEKELATDQPSPVVIDCSQLTYCDSTGISAFVRLHQQQTGQGHVLRLAAVPDFLGRLFALTGLDQIMSLHADTDEALAADGGERGAAAGRTHRPEQPEREFTG